MLLRHHQHAAEDAREHREQQRAGQGPHREIHDGALSHHWRVLREAGLTTTTVEGRRRWIVLRRDDLQRRFPGLLNAVLA